MKLLYNCSAENYFGVVGSDDEPISSDMANYIRNGTAWEGAWGYSILHRFDGGPDNFQVSRCGLICHVGSLTLGELVQKRFCEGIHARCLEPKFKGLVWCCGVCPE